MSKTKIPSKNEIPIPSYKHKFTRLHSFTGFTLVELIVVITLLAILGTIAFLSLQGYSRSARDSVRIENLTSIKKGLDMFQVVSSTYPLPEGYITLTASGTPIGYQGFIKEQGESIAKISPGGSRDPLDSNIYTTYSVNTSKTRMQLMSFLEDGGSVSAFVPPVQREIGEIFVQREGGMDVGRGIGIEIGREVGSELGEIFPVAFASSTSDYTLRTPLSKGDSLGILLSSSTGTLNQPVQENYSVSSFTGVDVVNTSSGYMAYIRQNKIINGTGNILKILTANNPRNPIAYANSCKDINDNGFSIGDGVYYINPTNTSTGSFQVYCDMITDGGGWTKVLDYNGQTSLRLSSHIEASDWVHGEYNYSRLYSMKSIKNRNNVYEFKIESFHGTSKLWLQFSQTNQYTENPVGNNFTRIGGDFHFEYPSSPWYGLALSSYGNVSMNGACILATSFGQSVSGTNWWDCIVSSGFSQTYGTGPWSLALGIGERAVIWQR